MKVKAEIVYTLRNFSTEDYQYTPYLGLEDHLHPDYESIAVHHIDNPGYSYIKGDNLVVKSKWVGHSYVEGDPLIIKAAPIMETVQPYTVTIKYSLRVPDDYIYVESLVAPTMNVTVRVNTPIGYEVRIGNGKATPMRSGGYWEYKQLFVAGEYVGIRWFPTTQGSKPLISSSDHT